MLAYVLRVPAKKKSAAPATQTGQTPGLPEWRRRAKNVSGESPCPLSPATPAPPFQNNKSCARDEGSAAAFSEVRPA